MNAWTLLGNTLLLAAGTVVVSVPAGTFLAAVLVRTDLPCRRPGLVLLGLLLLVPLYLQAAAWQSGLGLQHWFPSLGAAPGLCPRWCGAIAIHALAAVPWVTLIVGAGLWLVEPELEEQALLDGPARQVFCRVTLRRALPAVGVAALWGDVSAAGEMTVTDLFALRTYAEEIYTCLALGDDLQAIPMDLWPGLLVLGTLAAAGMVLCLALAPRQRPIRTRPLRRFPLGRFRWPVALLALAAFVLLVGVPLGNLVYQAGMTIRLTAAEAVRGWSPLKCATMVFRGRAHYPVEFNWSLVLSNLAAAGAVAAAIPLAWLARRRGAWSLPLLSVSALGLAVPGPAWGLAIIWLLNRPEVPWLRFLYDNSILAPWLALSLRALAPAAIIVWHGLESVPQAALDSAAVDGAGPLRRLLWIALPSAWPALAAAWAVALAVALGDLAASILVVPPGVNTLSIRIFGLLHYGAQDRVAGIALALVAAFMALGAVAGLLLWYAGRTSGPANQVRPPS